MENHMEWLREDMRVRLGNLDFVWAHNVLPFSKDSPKDSATPETDEGATALDLIDEAALMVRNLETRAHESEMRSGGILRWANEKLHDAERQIESSNAARHAAEQDRREATARAERAEQACDEARSRAAVTEAELYAMQKRMNAAEAEAEETKQLLMRVVTRVEDAIRTKVLNLKQTAISERNLVA